jgi:hypothetical protein
MSNMMECPICGGWEHEPHCSERSFMNKPNYGITGDVDGKGTSGVQTKPKEWWIFLGSDTFTEVGGVVWKDLENGIEFESVSVIEKSADNALQAENERLKEVLSYLPKIPTQPYEKELAKELIQLKKENKNYKVKLSKIVESLATVIKYCGPNFPSHELKEILEDAGTSVTKKKKSNE